MNDFLDNLGANQYRKMHQPKKIKLTPQTFIDMNEEFSEKGDRVRVNVPTQEEIDKWQETSRNSPYIEMPPSKDLVQEMWDKIGGRPND
jgi:hypothetical protein|tara:strand:- start:8 stop:274 length:267 start_codon:yes stop_codon:yes gene_type:complete